MLSADSLLFLDDAGFTFPFKSADLAPRKHDPVLANGPLAPQQTSR
jgi:hypothetical protein